MERYHISFVENNEPKLRSFNSNKELQRFEKKIYAMHKKDPKATWVDFVIFGEVVIYGDINSED